MIFIIIIVVVLIYLILKVVQFFGTKEKWPYRW